MSTEAQARKERQELLEARRSAGRPKPDPRALIPHPEDFAAWCAHPVTRFVATVFAASAQKQREEWTEVSWGTGSADPNELNLLRARADAYMAFLETGLERYAELFEQT